ncbi:uncharacterized, partial [Tachysurus ichikawai]
NAASMLAYVAARLNIMLSMMGLQDEMEALTELSCATEMCGWL